MKLSETSGRLYPLWPQDKRLHTPRITDYRHTRQDRRIQTELVSSLAKNATKPNPFEIILLQTTRKENNWKTEETLERAVVTLETERIKGSNSWCLWWWWWCSTVHCKTNEVYFDQAWDCTYFRIFIIFDIAKKLVLKSTFQASIYCSKCRNSLPSHPLYIRYIEKIKSKILMRCTDFMAQVNYCKRGQGPCEFNLPVQQE